MIAAMGRPQLVRETKRVTIELDRKDWALIEREVREQGVSQSEAVRRAIYTRKAIYDRVQAGAKIFVRKPPDPDIEIILTDIRLR
jgi:hypothetical protein